MISLKTAIIISVVCFVLGELFGIYIIAWLSANKRDKMRFDNEEKKLLIEAISNE